MSSETVYDVCIVGAGMFGSAAARHASLESSLKICLIGPTEPTADNILEREIFGAHYDEGRIVRNLDDNPARVILSKNSIKRFRKLEKQSGISFYKPVGCLFVSHKEGQYLKSIERAAGISEAPLIKISGTDALQERFPFLSLKEDEAALLDESGGGYISPRKLVHVQKKLSERQGCCVIDSVVNAVNTSPDGVHEIKTETGDCVKANQILICTGSFANFKIQSAMKPLDIKCCQETVVLLNVTEEEAERLRLMPTIIRRRTRSSGEFGAYILPPIKYPDGKYYLKYGSYSFEKNEVINSLIEMKMWYLSDGDKRLIDTHLEFVTELLPGLKVIGIKTVPCGLCYTRTGLPYIDRVSPTVTVAVGGSGRGAKFSDEVGRIAACLSTTGTWDSKLSKDQFKAYFQ